MIFVTVGSQKFQFNRLLKEIDKLVADKIITEEVFAQIGVSDYIPRNYKYTKFLSFDEFNQYLNRCDMVITHAGTGVIVNSVKLEKKVIAIPRLKKYKEHVDDHQIQLIDEFKELNFVESCYEIKNLKKAIKNTRNKKYNKYVSNTDKIIESIEEFIEK